MEDNRATDIDVETFYEIDRVVQTIKEERFRRVAVQFPDALLADATEVVARLSKRVSARIFVLADTTYGAGCPDVVAAEHYGADCIVLVGQTDQTTCRLPVIFVFGRLPYTVEDFDLSGVTGGVVLYDVRLHHLRAALEAQLGPDVELADPITFAKPAGLGRYENWVWPRGRVAAAALAARPPRLCGRRVRARPPFAHVHYLGPDADGQKDSPLLRRALLRAEAVTCVAPGLPAQSVSSLPLQMQRYAGVEHAREARTVGLLIATADLPDLVAVQQRLSGLLRRARRSVWSFVVGKITVEKIANFPEVDLFCLLSSPEAFLFDASDFMVPICSPYELEVALDVRDWGDYALDLEDVLAVTPREPEAAEDSDGEETAVQTLNGALVTFGADDGRDYALRYVKGAKAAELPPLAAPAPAAVGLDGVPSRYLGVDTDHG